MSQITLVSVLLVVIMMVMNVRFAMVIMMVTGGL